MDFRAPEEIKEFGEPSIADNATVIQHFRASQGIFTPMVRNHSCTLARTLRDVCTQWRLRSSVASRACQTLDVESLYNCVQTMARSESSRGGTNGGTPRLDVHRISILNRARFIRALLPRMPPLKVLQSALYQVWDAYASQDILLQCVPSA
jgi:hypothetical protein